MSKGGRFKGIQARLPRHPGLFDGPMTAAPSRVYVGAWAVFIKLAPNRLSDSLGHK